MKSFAISLVSSICVIATLALPQMSMAQSVPLVFQTTFNCPDWDQAMGLLDSDVCSNGDGISGHGNWLMNGSPDLITALANNPNNPAGIGSKGFRHLRGNGTNIQGGGLQISLPTAVTEMWVRFYMRYSLGFAWSGGGPAYTKDHYWGGCGSGCIVFGIQGNGSWGINYNGGTNHPSSLTWAASQNGTIGDGLWHVYEYHVKQNGQAGTIEIWVDNVRVLNKTADLGNTPWQAFSLGENQSTVAGCTGTSCYTDYDDIAISTTGRVGPIGTVFPPAPKNLRVQ